jgi:hypothetical protein
VPKAKTKTKPKKPNNVVKLDEVKEEKKKPIKEKNFSLDRGTDGGFIVCLNHYYNIDPNRWFTTWDEVKLLNGAVSKSSLEKWRKYNKDDGDERGPQYHPFSPKVVKYKARWLVRFREGLPWEKPVVELPHHFAVTASNIPQKKSQSIK